MAAQKLKVFQARFGFYDVVVAAPSQAAAQRVFGTRQNLFASGDAKVTLEKEVVAAATARPGALLRRAIGSTAPYEEDPKELPPTPHKAAAQRQARAAPRPPARPPPPNRSALDAAETALARLEDARAREEEGFEREREALAEREKEARKAFAARRARAAARVFETKSAYRRAGGKT
jgi:hypothetical protein